METDPVAVMFTVPIAEIGSDGDENRTAAIAFDSLCLPVKATVWP